MRFCKYLVAGAVVSVVTLLGCSNDSSVAGNSAETGSPELAGILVFDNGKPAALALVQCVPHGFDPTKENLPAEFMTETGPDGSYYLDSIPEGVYAIEAFHEESGKLMLVQNVIVSEDDSVVVSDTLFAPGIIELHTDSLKEGTTGIATVLGTTILRDVTVKDGMLTIDSLPAGALAFKIFIDGDTLLLSVTMPAGDTLEIGTKKEQLPPPATTFMAPLALPKGTDTLTSFISDIPLALRLTPDNSEFDALAKMTAKNFGRWEVVRVSSKGSRSKKLPIAKATFDTLAKEAVFWVSVDSLNIEDSLELSFDSTIAPAYASDVFPTNRSYSLVWHYDSGTSPVVDDAEKSYFTGTAKNASVTAGVVGNGLSLGSDGYIVADNSAEIDAERKLNMIFGTEDYFCFSMWVQLESLDQEQTIFEKPNEYALRFDPEKGFVVEGYHKAKESSETESATDTKNYMMSWSSGTEGISAGKWIYVAFNRQKTSIVNFYIDGAKVKLCTEKFDWDGEQETLQDFKVGGFAGKVDELMIGGCYRDDSWSRLTYLNQKPEGYWPILTGR